MATLLFFGFLGQWDVISGNGMVVHSGPAPLLKPAPLGLSVLDCYIFLNKYHFYLFLCSTCIHFGVYSLVPKGECKFYKNRKLRVLFLNFNFYGNRRIWAKLDQWKLFSGFYALKVEEQFFLSFHVAKWKWGKVHSFIGIFPSREALRNITTTDTQIRCELEKSSCSSNTWI